MRNLGDRKLCEHLRNKNFERDFIHGAPKERLPLAWSQQFNVYIKASRAARSAVAADRYAGSTATFLARLSSR